MQTISSSVRSPVLLSHTWFNTNLPSSKAMIFPNQSLWFSRVLQADQINSSHESLQRTSVHRPKAQCKLHFPCDLWWLEIIERQLIFLHNLPCNTVVCYSLNLFQVLKWTALWFSRPWCLHILRRGLSDVLHIIPVDVKAVSITCKISHFFATGSANDLVFARTILSCLIMSCVIVAWNCQSLH